MPHSLQWSLRDDDRRELLERFPPSYPDVIADHVTFEPSGAEGPPRVNRGRVVGIVNDGDGLEALVVEVDGSTDRPDGSTYHITWSLDRARGRVPVQSNDVLAQRGWQSVAPVDVSLEPRGFGG